MSCAKARKIGTDEDLGTEECSLQRFAYLNPKAHLNCVEAHGLNPHQAVPPVGRVDPVVVNAAVHKHKMMRKGHSRRATPRSAFTRWRYGTITFMRHLSR